MKRSIRDEVAAMNGGQHLQRRLLGRPQPRLPAGLQLRPFRCQLPYFAVWRVLSCSIVGKGANVGLSWPAQESKLVLVPPYCLSETMILFAATRLLRSTHGVLNQLLEWHLLGWEASGTDKP